MPKALKEIFLCVVVNSRDQVLIIQRKKSEKGKGTGTLSWAFPGGSRPEDETVAQTLEREVFEETGYKVTAGKLISSRRHPQFPVKIYYYSGSLLPGEPSSIDDPEITRCRWVDPKTLVGRYFTSDFDSRVSQFLSAVV